MKKHFSTILLYFILFIGLSLLLYPTVSDYWNSFTQSKAIASYAEDVARLDEKDYSHLWEAAQEHNRELQALGGVDRHQRNGSLFLLHVVQILDQLFTHLLPLDPSGSPVRCSSP